MNKKIVLLLLILVTVCSISHVSATDDIEQSDIEVQDISTTDYINLQDETSTLTGDDNEEMISNANSYREIQNLIDSANDGDKIQLNGSYECDYLINVNKSVEIIGNDTTITWGGNDDKVLSPYFNIKAPNVILRNIKFVGGQFNFGGAITWNANNGLLDNCEFSNFIANNDETGIGGALLLLGNNCNITNCNFKNNEAYQNAGAILCYGDNTLISKCNFSENVAKGDVLLNGSVMGYGGALVIFANECIVDNCIFTKNQCINFGGAIAILNNTNRIINSKFNGNSVTGTPTDEGNKQFVGGGAIFSNDYNLVIDGCSFIGNTAPNSMGGALNLGLLKNLINNSYFEDNKALAINDILTSNRSNITSNHIVLPYKGTIAESIYSGMSEDELEKLNTFVHTKIDSSVRFISGMVFEYGGVGKINVLVEGGTLELKNIQVINHKEAKIDFRDNVLTVSGLGVGTYTLMAVSTPDSDHNEATAYLTITVKKATAVIKASSKTVGLKKGYLWTIKIVDSRNNNPISNMKVTLKVYTGKKFKNVNLKTNSKGEANYKTQSLSKGKHKVSVSASHSGYNFNTVKSSINVIKQRDLKIKVVKGNIAKGATLAITVKDKKTKKLLNGIKLTIRVYTGGNYKTITIKTHKSGKVNGAAGFGSNKFSVGTHKVVIEPSNIKYWGYAVSKMTITKKSKKQPWEFKDSG